MSEIANLFIKISADVQQAVDNLKQVQTTMVDVGNGLKDAGGKLTTFLTLPIAAAGVASFKMASDFNESLNKVTVAFGENSIAVEEWSKSTLSSFGIAQGTALDMSALFGDMGTSMGLTTQEASTMSMSMVGLAGDLASFKNINIEQATTALAGVFTGETESLKRLGVVMNETTLEQYALEQGITTAYKEMTQAEKVALRYQFVMDATKNSQGDFARTSDGAANQMRIFQESVKQVSATFGQVLLPVITPLIQKVNEFMTSLQNLSQEDMNLIINILGIVAVIGPLLMIVGNAIIWFTQLQLAFTAVSAVITAAGGAMAFLTTTLLPIIAIIAAIIAVGILLYKNWDFIVLKAQEVWTWVTDTFGKLFVDVKSIFWNIWLSAQTIWNELYKTISVYVDLVMSFVKWGLDKLSEFWNTWGSEITAYVSAIWGIIYGTIQTVIYIIKDIIGFVLAFIRGDWEKAFNYLYDIAVKIFNWIKDTVFGSMTKIKDIIFDIFGKIDLSATGKAIIDGLWNGIQSAADWIWGKLTDLANKIKDTFAKILQIHSPSKVFEGFGQNIAQGLANGMSSAQDLVANASMKMADVSVNGYMNVSPENSSYGQQGVNQTIVINAPTELNPMEVARQTNKLARQLAVGLY